MDGPLLGNQGTQRARTWLRERGIPPAGLLAISGSLALLYALTCTLTAEADVPLPVAMASSPAAAGPTLVQTITNPDATFLSFGLVAMPLLLLSAKGMLTFSMQTAFFLGPAICKGSAAIVEKLNADMQFTKVSIAFQVLGQLTSAAAYLKLALATQFWRDRLCFEMFCYLVSQSPASVTLVVGLANNSVVKVFTETGSTENSAAKVLVFTGLCISMPIWFAFAYACVSMQFVFLIVAFSVAVKTFSFVMQEGFVATAKLLLLGSQEDRTSQPTSWFGVLSLTNVILGILWCCGGLLNGDAWHSVLLVGAVLAEFFVPMFLLLLLAISAAEDNDAERGAFRGMLTAFGISLNVAFMISMVTPAGLLEGQSGITPSDAAIEAFWGKKISKYMAYTFFVPARSEVELLEKECGRNSAGNILVLWLTQLISFAT